MALSKISTMTIEGNNIVLFPNEAKEAHLPNLIGAMAGDIPLIRSEDIDTTSKCGEFLRMAKLLHNKCGRAEKRLRISSMHLNNIREEWPFIKEQHRCLLNANQTHASALAIAHISLPTERVFFKVTPRFMSPFLQHKLKHLLQQFNAEATCMYYTWVCEEIEEMLKKFKPEAGEEYTLQAILEDFCHEVHSGFLKMYMQEISEAAIGQGKLDLTKDKDKMFELEKIVVAGRMRLLPVMQYQCTLLKKIIQSVAKMGGRYPKLKTIANIAYLLMGHQFDLPDTPKLSWGQRIMFIQLLDQQLGVVSALNSHTGLGRTSFVFSMRLALASMTKDYPEKEILDLCLHWAELYEGVLGKEMRRRVWINFEALKVPLRTAPKREGVLNVEFLQFLPEKVQVNGQEVILLEYDSKKVPKGFTKDGERLLRV